MSKSEPTPFTIPSVAVCSDGICGDLARVVIDPIARTVTHLVIEPRRGDTSRLVPLDLVDGATHEPELRLRCTLAEFEDLNPAEEDRFLQNSNIHLGYGPGQVYAWPYFGLGIAGMGMTNTSNTPPSSIHDLVPVGEITVRRGEQVHATDGPIGRVQGVVVDPANHKMTHVLLQEGHLWGRKEVAIPSSSVADVKDGIRLNLTKEEVRQLPAVAIEQAGEPLVVSQGGYGLDVAGRSV